MDTLCNLAQRRVVMASLPKLPLDGGLLASIDEDRIEKLQVVKLRETLAYLKVCGINAAKVYVHYREMEAEWARPVASLHESKLFEISREMQRVMDTITQCEKLDNARRSAISSINSSYSYAGDIEPSTLLEQEQDRQLLSTELGESLTNATIGRQQVAASEYSRATVGPFTEMWKQCMELIDPNEELDIQMFFGEDDPVFSVTVLATTCPISREPYFNVVRTRCNHRFNKSSIENSMVSGQPMQCPIGACNNIIRQGDWQPDPEYEQKVKEMQKRRKRQTHQEEIATLA